jgi:hypothetical protein
MKCRKECPNLGKRGLPHYRRQTGIKVEFRFRKRERASKPLTPKGGKSLTRRRSAASVLLKFSSTTDARFQSWRSRKFIRHSKPDRKSGIVKVFGRDRQLRTCGGNLGCKSRPFRGQRVRKGANMDAGKSLQLKDAIKERGESTSIFYSQAVVAKQSSMPMQNIPKVRQDFIPPYSTLQESHPASFSVLRSSKIEKPCNCVVSSILSIFFLFPTASAQSATTDDIGSTSNFLRQRRLQHLLHTLLHLIQFGQ